jgi:hypothetical protein
MQSISFRSARKPAGQLLCEEPEPRVSADAQKWQRRSIATVDGLVSVTQQAWGLNPLSGNEPHELN